MMIQKIFQTYRDDYPLQLTSKNRISFNGDTLYELMTGLILELSDLATAMPYFYISRHGNDKIPQESLAPFLFPLFFLRNNDRAQLRRQKTCRASAADALGIK